MISQYNTYSVDMLISGASKQISLFPPMILCVWFLFKTEELSRTPFLLYSAFQHKFYYSVASSVPSSSAIVLRYLSTSGKNTPSDNITQTNIDKMDKESESRASSTYLYCKSTITTEKVTAPQKKCT